MNRGNNGNTSRAPTMTGADPSPSAPLRQHIFLPDLCTPCALKQESATPVLNSRSRPLALGHFSNPDGSSSTLEGERTSIRRGMRGDELQEQPPDLIIALEPAEPLGGWAACE